jgi:hypothetical protein
MLRRRAFYTHHGHRFSLLTSGTRLRSMRESHGISPERLSMFYAGGVPVSRILEIEQLPAVDKRVRNNYHTALDHAIESAQT